MAPAQDTRPITLSHTQLTSALVLVTLLPFLLVVVLYTFMPSVEDPVLDVTVKVGPQAWPDEQDPDARIVPCVVLTNPTEDGWKYLNMSINHQFHFMHPDPVPAGGRVTVPLKFFHTKGNAYFPPENQDLEELTIYAQIPSGARAIREFSADELGFQRPSQSDTK